MSAACGAWTLLGEADDGTRLALPLRCHSWACPECAPLLRAKLLTKLGEEKVHSLLTLTSNPAMFETRLAAFHRMTLAVNILFKRIRRHCAPKGVEYFLVWETTKKGWPHAHLLLRGPYIPQALLSAWWKELAGSPIVDIRRVRSRNDAARYIAKYLTKALSVPPGFKRWRSSRGFFAHLTPSESLADFGHINWKRVNATAASLAALWRSDGLLVTEWWDGLVTARESPLRRQGIPPHGPPS